MAKPKRLSSLFICFRSPDEVSDEKPSQMVESGRDRKKTRRFSWSRFRMNKTSAAKTVPVETSVTPKATGQIKETQTENGKLSGELKIKRTTTAARKSRKPMSITESGQTTAEKPGKRKYGSADKEIILENSTPAGQSKADTCLIPICLKFDSKNPIEAPAVEAKRKQPRGGGAPTVSHSISFPPHNKETASQASQVSKKDPIVGLSIVLVILVILLIWGRLCAILCTCAWFYLIPRFNRNTPSQVLSDSKDLNLNLDSEEYKKKIILEGLLQRKNHRSNSFGLL